MKHGRLSFINFLMRLIVFQLAFHSAGVEASFLEQRKDFDDFNEMSFEELMDIQVISASKKPEKLAETAAAIFVITQEDIRRSGVSTIPDALRLAPGVHVARVNTHWWAINIRGFNEDLYSNKLLVLIDGRSVYNPIYSGVFWDVQDTLLEDVERIEVIRGPGSAVWGANAVNGVINIITKHAAKTTGWFVASEFENLYRGSLNSIRYGANIGETASYRLFARYFSREAMDESMNDRPQSEKQPITIYSEDRRIDNWQGYRGGFRIDWEPSYQNSINLQSEAYYNQDMMETSIKDESYEETSNISGAFLLSSWEHRFSNASETVLQFYYDLTSRDSQQAKYSIHVLDLDLRYQLNFSAGNELCLGLGYRFSADHLENFYMVNFSPDKRQQHLASAFIQGSKQFFNDKLRLILGSKFEHNDYTGLEVQPSLRMVWTPKFHYSLWSAVSRAVRVPSRSERDGTFFYNFDVPLQPDQSGSTDGSDPGQIEVEYREIPSQDFDAEKVTAIEGGIRLQPTDFIWADLSLFYNRYQDLKQLVDIYPQGNKPVPKDPAAPGNFPREIKDEYSFSFHRYPINNIEGKSFGGEIALDIKAGQRWRIKPSYSWLKIDLRAKSEADDFLDFNDVHRLEHNSPRQMFSVRSECAIAKNVDFDLGLRYVDSIYLDNREIAEIQIDDYVVFDVRLAWRPFAGFEASITGRDLWKSHAELSELKVCPSLLGKVTWRF